MLCLQMFIPIFVQISESEELIKINVNTTSTIKNTPLFICLKIILFYKNLLVKFIYKFSFLTDMIKEGVIVLLVVILLIPFVYAGGTYFVGYSDPYTKTSTSNTGAKACITMYGSTATCATVEKLVSGSYTSSYTPQLGCTSVPADTSYYQGKCKLPAVCGDSLCNGDETQITCLQDCGGSAGQPCSSSNLCKSGLGLQCTESEAAGIQSICCNPSPNPSCQYCKTSGTSCCSPTECQYYASSFEPDKCGILDNSCGGFTLDCPCPIGQTCTNNVCGASYRCTGTVPTNAALCTSDNTGLTADTARTTVTSCTIAKKCEYTCSTGYVPSADKMSCVQASYSCTGTEPSYTTVTVPALATGIIKGPSTYSPSTYTPTSWTYSDTATTATSCKWKCNPAANYCYLNMGGDYCLAGPRYLDCSAKPVNTDWNDDASYPGPGKYTQTCSSGSWSSTPSTIYSTTIGDCKFKCSSGYTWDGTICKVACTPSYKNNCDSTDGCNPARTSNPPYNLCDLTSNVACGTESACSDSIDNNCNGESDYDSMDGRHGDINCAVGVTGISAPASAYVNSVITVSCTSSVANVNSISATLGGSLCVGYSWNGNVVSFSNCNTGSTAGTKTATCYVDTAKSYKSGTDKSASVNVITQPCSSYSSSSTCPTATCDWCAQCSNPFSTGQANACVSKGSCTRTCYKGQCGATCDSTTGGCSVGYACDANCACIQTCKTSGSCSSNSEACSGYWCSSNNVCQNTWHWTGTGCERASLCGGSCPWTPLQSEYWTHLSDCIRPSKACCEVNYGGVITTDWRDVTEIK